MAGKRGRPRKHPLTDEEQEMIRPKLTKKQLLLQLRNARKKPTTPKQRILRKDVRRPIIVRDHPPSSMVTRGMARAPRERVQTTEDDSSPSTSPPPSSSSSPSSAVPSRASLPPSSSSSSSVVASPASLPPSSSASSSVVPSPASLPPTSSSSSSVMPSPSPLSPSSSSPSSAVPSTSPLPHSTSSSSSSDPPVSSSSPLSTTSPLPSSSPSPSSPPDTSLPSQASSSPVLSSFPEDQDSDEQISSSMPANSTGLPTRSQSESILTEVAQILNGDGVLSQLAPFLPSESHPSRRLKNVGDTCFLNASIQLVAQARQVVDEIDNDDLMETPSKIICHVLRLVTGKYGRCSVDEELLRAIRSFLPSLGRGIGPTGQQDSSDTLIVLLQSICATNGVKALFGVDQIIKKCCPRGHSRMATESFELLSVPLPADYKSKDLSLISMLEAMCGRAKVTVECGGECEETDMEEPSLFEFRKYIFLSLNRIQFLETIGKNGGLLEEKVTKEVDVPLTLNTKGLVEKGKEQHYQLIGVVNHVGNSPRSGHYTATGKTGDEWILYDDHHVKKVEIEQVKKDVGVGYAYLYEKL